MAMFSEMQTVSFKKWMRWEKGLGKNLVSV